MKIRKSSRIAAIVLALMMIVPLISVPTFAADGDVLYSQDFESVTNAKDVVEPAASANTSGTIKDIGGEYGKVFFYDLTEGATKELMADGKEVLYISTDVKNNWTPLDEYTVNADGTITGTAGGNALLILNAKPDNNRGGSKIQVKNGYYTDEPVLDEEGYPVLDENGEETVNRVYTDQGTVAGDYYFTTSQVRAGMGGGIGNVGAHNKIRPGDLAATVVTYTWDMYIDAGVSTGLEGHALSGTAQLWSANKKGMNYEIGLHGNVTATGGSRAMVATNQWFNMSVVVDYANATVAVYLNGKLTQTGNLNSADKITAAAGNITGYWNIFQLNRQTGGQELGGYVMVDNAKILDGSVIPAETKTLTYNYGAPLNQNADIADGGHATMSYIDKYSEYGDNALVVNVDTNGSTSNSSNPSIDKSTRVNNGELGYSKGHSLIVLEADYYFPTGTWAKVQSQAYKWSGVKLDGSAGPRTMWFSFYVLRAEGNKLTLTNESKYMTSTIYKTDLPMDEWFTLSTVIETESGVIRQYVNGEQYNEWQAFDSSVEVKNFTLTGGYIFSKLNNVSGAGMSGGYKGDYAVDNVALYTDLDLLENYSGIRDDRFFNYDFNDETVGASAGSPSSAVYAEFDGDIAIKLDMLANIANGVIGSTSGEYLASCWNRAYWLDATKDVTGFDPATATFDQLTVVKNTYNETGKNVLLAVRDGNTAYFYQAVAGANEEASNAAASMEDVKYVGTTKIYPSSTSLPGTHDAIIGISNADKPLYIANGAISYKEGEDNTYVYNASYYIPEETKGAFESQIVQGGKYYALYKFDLFNKKFTKDGAVTGDLKVNAWNKVTVIITLGAENSTFDVYLNGAYTHSYTHATASVNSNSWSVAKVMKNATPDNGQTGSFYIDDVNCQKYDAAKATTIDVSKALEITIDGAVAKLPNNSGKFYGVEVAITKTFDATAYADIVKTTDYASVRLNAPTGLRFLTEVNADMIAELEAIGAKVELGTLIAPADFGAPNFADYVVGEDCIDVKATVGKYYPGETPYAGTFFAGSIVAIKETNMDRDFIAVGYAKITLATGAVEYVYSATTKSISVADQAAKTVAAEIYAPDSAEGLILAEFAAYAQA